ncbi:MAG: sulfotransferase family 2 domain-containing protein [Thermodesulfobacteriota bacterium]|jgi:hypothetical protein
MLFSLKHKFLFVHIAKTGGTSIRAALSPYRWKGPYGVPLFLCSRMSALCNHRLACKIPRHARAVAALEMFPREQFQSFFKFAFVRNPWDLQVSSYHHIRRERPHLIEHVKDFQTFLHWKLAEDRPYNYIVDTSMTLQSSYLVDLNGNVIVDFIGRYENLTSDFNTVCRKIGIRAPKLPHKRRAVHRKPYQEYYNEKTARLVADYFAPDIKMFGYTFS